MKMHLVATPNCLICGVREDNTHIFTECNLVREAWGWVRLRLLSLLPDDCARTSNFEMISLFFTKHIMDKEAVWLIGTYVQLVWAEKVMRKRRIGVSKVMGHVKLCYKANQISKRPHLNFIMNISN